MKRRSNRADSLPCVTRSSWTAPTPDTRRRDRCRTNRTHTATCPVAHDGLGPRPRVPATSLDIPRAHDIADICGDGRDERSRPPSHLHSRSIAIPERTYRSGRMTPPVSVACSPPRVRHSHARADDVTTGATDAGSRAEAKPHVRAAHPPTGLSRNMSAPALMESSPS